jgi:PPOX class F420-dependent enzyme/OxyR family protein
MRPSARTSGSTSRDDRDHPAAEVLTIVRRQSREERLEFSRHLAVESGCCSPTGLSQSYMPCAPVAMHRRSFGQAAALDSVHEASERSFFHTEAPREFCHTHGTLSQHAQQPGLNRRQVMALGDPRIGMNPAKTRKFRNVHSGNTRVALVIDDLVSVNPWTVRGLRIYGSAEIVSREEGQFGPGQYMRIRPIISWSWNLGGRPTTHDRPVVYRLVVHEAAVRQGA